MNNFLTRSIQTPGRTWVAPFVKTHSGSEIIVAKGRVIRPNELDGFAAFRGKDPVGLLTYRIEGVDYEIVTLDSTEEGIGIGTALIDTVKKRAKAKRCKRLWLITTNDNLNALGFYQKRGFQIVAVRPNAVDEARKLKPQISLKAANGIPIRDELELRLKPSE